MLIQVITEVEDRDMLNKVYKTINKFSDGEVAVKHEGYTTGILRGEYRILTEEEAMIELFKNLTGKEPQYVSNLEEARNEIERLESKIEELEDELQQLTVDMATITRGY